MFGLVICFLSIAYAQDLGDRLFRQYTLYNDLPLGAASAATAGYRSVTGMCEPGLGIEYAKGGQVTYRDPLSLYFTPRGKIAGVKVTLFGGNPVSTLHGWWQKDTESNQWFLTVSFRSASDACSTSEPRNILGDRAVVNTNGKNFGLPLNEHDAISGGWYRGACYYGMGYHYFYDLSTYGNMSWVAGNLLPVVTMFNTNGQLQSIFFATTIRQQSVLPPTNNGWEPIPLTPSLMCGNWCSPDCGFSDMGLFDVWSTMHLYFRDLDAATCPNGCTRSCCY